jgi:hypothetical protein
VNGGAQTHARLTEADERAFPRRRFTCRTARANHICDARPDREESLHVSREVRDRPARMKEGSARRGEQASPARGRKPDTDARR